MKKIAVFLIVLTIATPVMARDFDCATFTTGKAQVNIVSGQGFFSTSLSGETCSQEMMVVATNNSPERFVHIAGKFNYELGNIEIYTFDLLPANDGNISVSWILFQPDQINTGVSAIKQLPAFATQEPVSITRNPKPTSTPTPLPDVTLYYCTPSPMGVPCQQTFTPTPFVGARATPTPIDLP